MHKNHHIMRILSPSKKLLLTITTIAFAHNINAQDQNLTLNQDAKFEQLLNEKRKINTSINTNDTYRFQIFSGKSDEAKKNAFRFQTRKPKHRRNNHF